MTMQMNLKLARALYAIQRNQLKQPNLAQEAKACILRELSRCRARLLRAIKQVENALYGQVFPRNRGGKRLPCNTPRSSLPIRQAQNARNTHLPDMGRCRPMQITLTH
ncbi:hypothetical protein [Acidihalobacter aeolianus]|uniref:hypothetical protein n=1 Tax=Acidihalobacter aeolianus TaxID=2792603 RepID=UPI0012EA3DDB|nr:hypothetical protein [Acidihalobacter aeolianus]